MNTRLLYFEDQSLSKAQATVVQVIPVDHMYGVVLDQTVFYVQGGGQPGDRGLITSSIATFSVSKTIKDLTTGQVLHIGSFNNKSCTFEVCTKVQLCIDEEYRQENSRLHSAGHLIDMAVQRVGLDWKSTKGSHFPDACYVEYIGAINTDGDLISRIQAEFDALVEQDLKLEITIDPSQTCNGMPLREVSFSGLAKNPCGGTHVRSSCTLRDIAITKIKSFKNGISKVNYK